MDITPVIPHGKKIIQRYGDGAFVISQLSYNGAVIVMPQDVVVWPVITAADITVQSLSVIVQQEPSIELLLIGTGTAMVQISPELRIGCRANNIALEVMDTGAACRTYNVLLAEGRRVAAALIAV